MNLLINFATPSFYKAQKFNSETALNIGGFDRVYCANQNLIDDQFKQQHQAILNETKGAGYWLWKPYFILRALEKLLDGDVLMYADSGSHYISSALPLLSLPKKIGQDIIPFELELREDAWTKRDTFYFMDVDGKGFNQSCQFLASFVVIKKSVYSVKFIEEYLHYCTDPRVLTDLDNTCGLPNYPNFIEHRHDQSIFSLLCKKHSLEGFRDPSQWGNGRINKYLNSNYPQIIEHTRQKDPKQAKLSYKIKRVLLLK